MALTEETLNDQIQVMNTGEYAYVQVREATIIKRDGVEISRTYHRHVVMPDADIAVQDADVAAICNAAFTQSVKDAYAAHQAQVEGQEPQE